MNEQYKTNLDIVLLFYFILLSQSTSWNPRFIDTETWFFKRLKYFII